MWYAVNHSNRAAASKFNIEPKCGREQRSVAEKFNTVKGIGWWREKLLRCRSRLRSSMLCL